MKRVGRNLSRVNTRKRPQKVKEKRMHFFRKREKNWFVKIVQKKAMMKLIVGNYILK